ncbi:MAG: hypothetical protein EZS28_002453 [Streblomastix strix]|uniref:Uncharacterized protein n=1 Tax=Streblomastix strix TaxID=222440 RepID=A0A5J4X4X1_9EUKA|nr:MAG: hypothetical protein EZS28_002453 [Streblomastix strix]
MSTVTGSSFIKQGADNSVVLLGAGGTKPLSEFTGNPTDLSNYYSKSETYSRTETDNKYVRLEVNGTKIFNANVNATGFVKTGKDDTSVLLAGGGDFVGASGASVAVCTLAYAGFLKYQFQAGDIVFAGSAPHVANFRFGTDGKVTITIRTLSGTAGLAGSASAYINITYPAAN